MKDQFYTVNMERDDIPNSVDGLIEFWGMEDIVEKSNPEVVQADILNYLGWVKLLLIENEQLSKRIESIERAGYV